MDANAGEAAAKPALEEGARGRVERPTGLAQYFAHARGAMPMALAGATAAGLMRTVFVSFLSSSSHSAQFFAVLLTSDALAADLSCGRREGWLRVGRAQCPVSDRVGLALEAIVSRR
ncbi:MAG TPA: hypothetical protein VMU34_15465 [Mycobacterium sp.]|nr:hypothetical protein [Mycobacterium sp.]